jgi:hypothetical protein
VTVSSSTSRRTDHLRVGTWVGSLTAMAAFALMLAVVTIGVSVIETDTLEAGIGYVVGAVGVLIWAALSAFAGRALVRASRNRRGILAALPAAISVVWCAVAGVASPWSSSVLDLLFASWPSSWGALWGAVSTGVMTAGTIPVALVLLVVHFGLRLAGWTAASSSN